MITALPIDCVDKGLRVFGTDFKPDLTKVPEKRDKSDTPGRGLACDLCSRFRPATFLQCVENFQAFMAQPA